MVYLWVIVLAALVAPSFFSRMGNDPSKASLVAVNGNSITMNQFKHQYAIMQSERQMFNQRYGMNLDTSINPAHAVDRTIEGVLVDQVASSQGFVVDQAVLGAMIRDSLSQMLGLPKNAFTVELYNYYIRQTGMTIREFEQEQETMLCRSFVDEAVRSSTYTPLFVKTDSDLFKKSFSVLRFSKDSYLKEIKSRQVIDDAELLAFYQENKAAYALPDLKQASYIVIDPHVYENKVSITDEQVEAYYNHRKETLYKDKDQYKIRRLLIAVPQGTNEAELASFKAKAEELVVRAQTKQEEFSDVVTKASDDTKTSKRGGMTDSFTLGGAFAPQLESVIEKLEVPGDITPVIRTNEGFECAQLVSKHVGTYKKLESVKKEIAAALTKRTASDLLTSDLKGLVRGQDGEVDLAGFAKEHHVKLEETGSMDESSSKIESIKGEVARKAFGSFMEKPLSRGSFVSGEKHVVFVVTRSESDRYEALEDIRSKVIDDLNAQKAQLMMEEDALAAQKAFFDGEHSLAVSEKNFSHASLHQTGFLNVKDTIKGFDKDHALTEKLFKLESAQMLVRATAKDGDIVLATLVEVEPLSDSKISKIDFERNSEDSKENLVRGFVASLKRNARIDIINDQFFAAQ